MQDNIYIPTQEIIDHCENSGAPSWDGDIEKRDAERQFPNQYKKLSSQPYVYVRLGSSENFARLHCFSLLDNGDLRSHSWDCYNQKPWYVK